jgi:hypothetical protein
MEMAKRLGGVGEVVRIGTERLIVSEVSSFLSIRVNDRISDLLRLVDHQTCIVISSLEGTRRLISMIFTMVHL